MTGIPASWRASDERRMLFMKSRLLRGRSLQGVVDLEWASQQNRSCEVRRRDERGECELPRLGLQSGSTCLLRIVELCFALPAAGPGTGRGRGAPDTGVQGKIMGQGASTQTLNPNLAYITGESFQTGCGFSTIRRLWAFSRFVRLFLLEAILWFCLCVLSADANCTWSQVYASWCEERSKRQAWAGGVNVCWWNVAIVQSDILMFLSSTRFLSD